jgi:hypothetical protein
LKAKLRRRERAAAEAGRTQTPVVAEVTKGEGQVQTKDPSPFEVSCPPEFSQFVSGTQESVVESCQTERGSVLSSRCTLPECSVRAYSDRSLYTFAGAVASSAHSLGVGRALGADGLTLSPARRRVSSSSRTSRRREKLLTGPRLRRETQPHTRTRLRTLATIPMFPLGQDSWVKTSAKTSAVTRAGWRGRRWTE